MTSISSRARPRPMSTVGPPPPSTTETPDSPYVRYYPQYRTIYPLKLPVPLINIIIIVIVIVKEF